MASPPEKHAAQPHLRFPHLYVVVRMPRDMLGVMQSSGQEVLEAEVTATKAFWSEDEAEAEAARLNGLNERYNRYVVRVARLVGRPPT